MLTVVQFPIADFRRLLDPGLIGRLPTPSWPPKTSIYPHFVRSFGKAAARLRGIDHAWLDESGYCDASRALRFHQLPTAQLGWQRRTNCAFRRLLSDGEVISRVEVGFSLLTSSQQARVWGDWDSYLNSQEVFGTLPLDGRLAEIPQVSPFDILAHVLALSTVVPSGSASSAGTRLPPPEPLIRQGKALGDLFFHATSPASRTGTLQHIHRPHRYLAPGSPVAIVECTNHWLDRLPAGFIEIQGVVGSKIRLAFGKFHTQWGSVETWLLGCDKAWTKHIRSMRMCLLRLHAEQQCLALVLDRVNSGGIVYAAGSDAGERIEQYLNVATRAIDREWWGKSEVWQSQVLAAFDALQASDSKYASRTELKQRLTGLRLQVRRKVEKFESRGVTAVNLFDGATYVEQQMTHNKTVTIGAGAVINAPVVVAESIEHSLNALAHSNLNDNLKSLVEQILAQVAIAAKTAPQESAAELAEHAEVLAKELARAVPRRPWYDLSIGGLTDGAKAIGEAGLPLLELTTKLAGLLSKIVP